MDNNIDMKFTMFENGLDFILSSLVHLNNVENEVSDDNKKTHLKYCLLNLSSGTELILKSRLYKEHWTYIFADMNSANKKNLITGAIKSIDSDNTIDRLDKFCDIKFNDGEKKLIKSLRNTRNRIEHFELNENLLSVKSKVNKVICILLNFITSNYEIFYSSNEDQYDKEKNIYRLITLQLSKLKEHYESAVKMAEASMNHSWDNRVICPKCNENFLIIGEPEGESHCYFCGYKDIGEKVALNYINYVLQINEYEVVTEGGEYPLYNCVNCGMHSFVLNEQCNSYKCFSCGEIYAKDDIIKCSDCGELGEKNEYIYLNRCSNCYKYRMNKDDVILKG